MEMKKERKKKREGVEKERNKKKNIIKMNNN